MTDPAIDRAVSLPPREWKLVPDQELVAHLRRGEQRAFVEFVERFQPLLTDRARRLGAGPDERDEMVLDTLTDVALALADRSRIVPRSLPGYLLVSLRNRIVDRARARRDASRDFCDGSELEWLDREATSAPIAPDHAPVAARLSPTLSRLAEVLDAALSDDDRQLLDWAAHHVTTSEMAEWLGLPRNTVKVRLWRLRARLRDVASRHALACDPNERRELQRFIARSSAVAHTADAAVRAPSTMLPQ